MFEHLNKRGVPLLVGENNESDPNHKVVFVNEQFTQVFGYTSDDVPDKNRWWELAYPDQNYRKVVMRQWELLTEQQKRSGEPLLEMDINITAKNKSIIRTKVTAEPPNETIPGYYIVTFKV